MKMQWKPQSLVILLLACLAWALVIAAAAKAIDFYMNLPPELK